MRTLFRRLLIVAVALLGLAGVPSASAKPTVPEPCDYLNNTHCHCFSPTTYRSCIIID